MKIKIASITFLSAFFAIYVGHCYAQTSNSKAKIELTQEQIVAFKQQAITSAADLSRHMATMVDKSNEIAMRNKAVDLAIKLFSSETNVVEISSLNTTVKQQIKIRQYFNRIKALPYSSIQITWYDIHLSKDLTLGADGKYYGVVSILQKFDGIGNNEIGSYEDITAKNITIVIEVALVFNGPDKKERWILKLGDIRVQETLVSK